MRQKIQLLIIDAQNSFVEDENHTPNLPGGNLNLAVPNAKQDMANIADLITRGKDVFYDIHATMDSHNTMHIATPIFWVDKSGNHPNPFTLITAQDVRDGVWKAARPSKQAIALKYVESLEKNGRYVLVIWPPHCVIGTAGHNIYPSVREAMFDWERNWSVVDFVTKGSNPFTEHYSVFKADVVDSNDPSTQLNAKLVQDIENADVIAIAGEALSHCIASSCTDLIDAFNNPDSAKKVVLLEDCMSVVPSFEQQATDFINRMKSLGVKFENSKNLI